MTPESLTPSRPVARAEDAHKGTTGAVLVVAGSRAYPGAAILAALGAGRAGAGLVHLALSDDVVGDVLPAVPFAIVVRGGVKGIMDTARRCDAIVAGPGLGNSVQTAELVSALVARVDVPLVLDADALNVLAQHGLQGLAERHAPTVLTPHPGEFARLTNTASTPQDDDGRLRAAQDFAKRFEQRVTLVLKGHHTVVTDGARSYVEQAGNPGMATGGMGDVLAGACATLLAQDARDPSATAALAVAAHARAADRAAARLTQRALLPTDVADDLGHALEALATD